MEEVDGTTSRTVGMIACIFLSFFYVAILYAPTLILRLPPPSSFKNFMIRRFVCAAISSVVSVIVSALILPTRSWEASYILDVYGIRWVHIIGKRVTDWLIIMLNCTFMYETVASSGLSSFLDFSNVCWIFGPEVVVSSKLIEGAVEPRGSLSFDCIKGVIQNFNEEMLAAASNVLTWRNYIVAPLTEELVFRACMIPVLLCGGFKLYTAIFLCPIFFSLAHLNHFMEIYSRHNYSLFKASMVVGLQLGYTVIFGWYASFLFIRTGHLAAPLVAHVFCNFMGLPVLFVRGKALVGLSFVAGVVAFVVLLFPVTNPSLYNSTTHDCRCWHGYCSWK